MRRSRKPWLAAAIAVAGSFAVAAPASAETAGVQDGVLVIAAAAGEANQIDIDVEAAGIDVRDIAAPLVNGPGCSVKSAHEVTCPLSGVSRIAATLDDGDDRLSARAGDGLDLPITADGGTGSDQINAMSAGSTLDGGAGADQLQGGSGVDHLTGGPGQDILTGAAGDDAIDAADAEYEDTVDCGAGNDSVRADPAVGPIPDEEATACETVVRPPLSVGGYLDGLNFKALPGVANDIAFTPHPDTMDSIVSDERGLVATFDCVHTLAGDLRTMICNSSSRGDFLLGDGNDRFRGGPADVTAGAGNDTVMLTGSEGSKAIGGAGNDRLTGGTGDQQLDGDAGNDTLVDSGGLDELRGGPGDDALSARDGARDDLLCGAGRDRAVADWLDYVWKCEHFTRGDTTPRGAFAATMKARTLTTFVHHQFPHFRLPVSCPAAAPAGCAVTMAVYLGRERRADVPFRPAAAPTVVAAGTTRSIDVGGESFGLQSMFDHKVRVSALIALVTTDAALHTRTFLRPVTIVGSARAG